MKLWRKIVLWVLILLVISVGTVFGINTYVTKSVEARVLHTVNSRDVALSREQVSKLKDKKAECIMVLGALIHKDGTLSYMLRDRLDVGIALYKQGVAPKLLLTGDHGQVRYDEVNAMKKYALSQGVPKEDLFLDHAGFSTYDSVYRAAKVFQVKRMITVTQGYHQYRTLYGCEKIGIEAWGVASDQAIYKGQKMRDLREIAARDKDYVKWIFKPSPTYLGDTVPISGNGIKSQD